MAYTASSPVRLCCAGKFDPAHALADDFVRLLCSRSVTGALEHVQAAYHVVLWLDSWLLLVVAAGSNTGCLAAASLAGAEMLMRGHKQHDDQLQALLDDPSYTCAVLVSSGASFVFSHLGLSCVGCLMPTWRQ
jgi:hypothetical protein